MPTIELNKRNIDSLKPEANRYTAWDSKISGFSLRITPLAYYAKWPAGLHPQVSRRRPQRVDYDWPARLALDA
jgi:hypothetical protein